MPAKRQGEEYPLKSGIIITPKTNPSGKRAWRVDISAKRTGLTREQKQFRSKQDAQTYAARKWAEIQSFGQRAFSLTAAQREDATRAYDLLEPLRLSLLDAVTIALRHARPAKPTVSLTKLRELFLAAPANRRGRLIQRRARSQGNQRARTAVFVKQAPELRVDEVTPDFAKNWFKNLQVLSPVTQNNYRRAMPSLP